MELTITVLHLLHADRYNNKMKAYTYSDVLIRPSLSKVKSRSDVNIDSHLTPNADPRYKLSLPVISANMKTITGSRMSTTMDSAGGLGIIHRDFNDNSERLRTISHVTDQGHRVGVAISIYDEDDFILNCADVGVEIFCVDVAHAHNTNVAKFVERIKKLLDSCEYPNIIIAGNVATGDGLKFLANAGS